MKYLKRNYLNINVIFILMIMLCSHPGNKFQNELLFSAIVFLVIIIILNFIFFRTEFAKFDKKRTVRIGDYLVVNSHMLIAFIIYIIASLFFESITIIRIFILSLLLIYSFSLIYIKKSAPAELDL